MPTPVPYTSCPVPLRSYVKRVHSMPKPYKADEHRLRVSNGDTVLTDHYRVGGHTSFESILILVRKAILSQTPVTVELLFIIELHLNLLAHNTGCEPNERRVTAHSRKVSQRTRAPHANKLVRKHTKLLI